jgi:hypothetical protein
MVFLSLCHLALTGAGLTNRGFLPGFGAGCPLGVLLFLGSETTNGPSHHQGFLYKGLLPLGAGRVHCGP